MSVPEAPLRIDEIQCWPIIVVEGPPNDILAVDDNGIIYPKRFNLPADVVDVLLKAETGVWTPITTNALSLYFSAQARR